MIFKHLSSHHKFKTDNLESFSSELLGQGLVCMGFLSSKPLLATRNCWLLNKAEINHQEEKGYMSNYGKSPLHNNISI